MLMKCPEDLVIARRPRWEGDGTWSPIAGAALSIGAARDAYDRGEIEMAQSVTAEDILLYAIPRLRRAPRRRVWFGRRAA